jgi:hypothetical protein
MPISREVFLQNRLLVGLYHIQEEECHIINLGERIWASGEAENPFITRLTRLYLGKSFYPKYSE